MPKELTHWILAERALDCLGSGRLRGVILAHHHCYLGGAVLPDTLLHLFRGNHAATALKLAGRFHDAPGNSFEPLIRMEERSPGGLPPATLSCLLGVVTHMLADITFHPLVYALAGSNGMGDHYRLETEMDVHFLRSGARPPVRHVAELLSPGVRPVLLESCALLFDPDGRLPRQTVEQALKLHCRFQGMYDRTFWKLAVRLLAGLAGAPFAQQRHLFYPLGQATGDMFNEKTVEWRHPFSGEQQSSTLEELADRAVGRMVSLFRDIENTGSLAGPLSEHPGENLLTGMHGACLSGSGDHGAD